MHTEKTVSAAWRVRSFFALFAVVLRLLRAGAALAAIPIVAVFLMFQKYFTQGITMGAVKG